MIRRSLELPDKGSRAVIAIRGITNLHERPTWESTVETQVLFSEALVVHGCVGQWLDASINFAGFWHRGYVHSGEVADLPRVPTHKVHVPWTPLRPMARHQGAVSDMLGRGSLLIVLEETEDQVRVWPSGWVFKSHVCPADSFQQDPLVVLKSMIGTPFLCGGRSAFGVDCAGLIQSALALCGIQAPRACIDLASAFGVELPQNEPVLPGDLIFYSESDTCGVLLNDKLVLHSDGKLGHVLIENRALLHRRMIETCSCALLPRRRFLAHVSPWDR